MPRGGHKSGPASAQGHLRHQGGRRSTDMSEGGHHYHDDDDYDPNADDADMQPIEVRRTPDDQIRHLTEEQLGEVFTKVLTATNPNVSRALQRFAHAEGVFKPAPAVTHMAVHFEMDGVLIHVDSDEAREQAEYISQQAEIERKSVATATESQSQGDAEGGALSARGGGDDPLGSGKKKKDEEEEEEEDDDDAQVPDDRALKNQFNFSERASQTTNNALRDREVCTEPPPTTEFSGNVTHFDIFDAYCEDVARQLNAKKEADAKPRRSADDDKDEAAAAAAAELALSHKVVDLLTTHEGLGLALKTMERMVNQNAESELFQEFKYFEDKVEAKRADANDKRGSFLPLWKFTFDEARRKTVTAITWNPEFTDLFAVAYGSYDFMKQSPGVVCCYSLKNTQYPEYKFTTESGVMCLDFHPVHTALLVCGLYDGTVCVYDVRSKSNEPIYMSSDPAHKHTDPVWQVRWQRTHEDGVTKYTKDDSGKQDNFFSISSDGRVTNWLLHKNELVNEEVIELKLMSGTKDHEEVPDNAMLGLAGGCCFDFNPASEHLFVVGTEEGAIQSYSKAYNSQFLRAFEGHHMAVYAVRWNPFHPHVFLTCSADWTVKLWEVNTTKPVMTFDLSCSVGDVAWAPYSSTVFGVVTADGKVRVFDLHVNKHEALGETRVNKKARLTHIVFNPREPVITVGDDRGVVHVLKLSQNLRRTTAPTLDELDPDEEIEKLDRLLLIDKDPSLFPLPAATANLLPQKKAALQAEDPVQKKKLGAAGGPGSPIGSKPNTQPNTARDGGKKSLA